MNVFFCRTPIHVFRAVQLTMQLETKTEGDIYVFDTFPFSEEIANRLKEKKIFSNVYYIKDRDYLKKGKAEGLRTTILPSEFKNILRGKKYGQIFLFNIYGAFNELIVNVLKKNNEKLVVNMVEDGPSIYHIEEYEEGVVRKYLYPIFGMISYLDCIDYWWFSNPELMKPLGNGKKKELPKVNKKNKEFIEVINYIYSYEDNPLITDADVIIMEECYWNDGLLKNGEDYLLFKEVKDSFASKNIVVKLHPRTKENRFKDEFQTVPANGIPWEVYALNMDMNKKILVSLSCATMISTKLLYDEETYSLLLYPILEHAILNIGSGEKYLTEERKQKIDSQVMLYSKKNKFAKAYSLEEAIGIIGAWLDR